jgi:hypothetical protein
MEVVRSFETSVNFYSKIISTFRRNILFPSSEKKGSRASKHKTGSELGFMLTCPTSFSSLNMEAIGFSETSVSFYQTTLRHIPEGNIVLLSPLSRVLLERLIVAWKVKKSIAVYGTRRLVAMFTKARTGPWS